MNDESKDKVFALIKKPDYLEKKARLFRNALYTAVYIGFQKKDMIIFLCRGEGSFYQKKKIK